MRLLSIMTGIAAMNLLAPGSAMADEVPAARTPVQLSAIAPWPGADVNDPDAFRFVIVSDATGGEIPGQWAKAVDQINLLRPDFVIAVGDLIEGYTEDVDELNRQWDAFEAEMRRLDAPFFPCTGNHDVSNAVMHRLYVERLGVSGQSWYSFNYRGCHFLVLDPSVYDYVPDTQAAQIAFVESDLHAAKDAQHTFIFKHFPRPGWGGPFWSQIRDVLNPAKTTVFTGHWHSHAYFEQDAFPTYILGPTAGPSGELGPPVGDIRQLTLVTVSRGKPTVTVVPVNQLRAGDYVLLDFAQAVTAAVSAAQVRAIPTDDGWLVEITQPNPAPVPVALTLTWQAEGYEIDPPSAALAVSPAGQGQVEFALKRLRDDAPRPVVTKSHALTTPTGEPVEHEARYELPLTLDLPRVTGVTIDGELADWAGVQPLNVAGETRVANDAYGWDGDSDLSFDVRLATDGEHLLLAVNVTDDVVAAEGLDYPWHSDAVELFWDVRPTFKRDGAHGEGTGHAVFVIQADGVAPKMHFGGAMRDRENPDGFETAVTRRPGGYVFELSVPLATLGAAGPIEAGDRLAFDIAVRDRDRIIGLGPITRMVLSSRDDGHAHTGQYAICKVE